MNRNTKIALGCGGASCLGLIAVVIVAVLLGVAGYLTIPGVSNKNSNTNSNYNSNSNLNSNTNRNSNSDSSSSSTMSNDDKHKLFQAAGATKDNQLILKALDKIGFPNGTGEGYPEFVKEHFPWAIKNAEFMQTVNTPEKARAYVDAHLDD